MIISHKSRYIFVHIEKTGGTSITEQFNIREARSVAEEVENVFSIRNRGQVKHLKLWQIRRDFLIYRDENDYDTYYRWSIVRNPFDRVISAFYQHLDWHKRYKGPIEEDINIQIRNGIISRMGATVPMLEYLFVDDKIDCEVFKFEDGLDSIVQRVSRNIRRYDPDFPEMDRLVPRHNTHLRKDRRHYREVLNAESRRQIEQRYQRDFEIFGYEW